MTTGNLGSRSLSVGAAAETPTGSQAPSAELVAVRVVLDSFFRKGDEQQWDLEEASWLRVLRGFDADEILSGWERYQQNGPRDDAGRLVRPSAHCIRQRIMARRNIEAIPSRPLPPSQRIDTEPRKVVDAETAERICQEYGFTPEHSRRVKRFPKAPTRQAIEDSRSYFAAAEQETRAAVDPDQLRRARESSAIGRAALADAQRRRKNIDPDDPGRDIVQPPSDNPGLDGEDPAAVPDGGNSRGGKGLDAAAGPAETRKGGQHSAAPDEAGS